MLKNLIRILKKVLVPNKATLSQMDQKILRFHLSEQLRQPSSRNLLKNLQQIKSLFTNLLPDFVDKPTSTNQLRHMLRNLLPLKKELALLKDTLLWMEKKTSKFHLLEILKLLFTLKLKLKIIFK